MNAAELISLPTFQPFPKIARLTTETIITEKIDGTNACIRFNEYGDITCQSRTRVITPEKKNDNYGFAAWAYGNIESLFADLGEGAHYGEWWGLGINRGYNQTVKRFSLFNTKRWQGHELHTDNLGVVLVVDVLPTFDTLSIGYWAKGLDANGSLAAPGYDRPEGVVAYNRAANVMFKAFCPSDPNYSNHKGAVVAAPELVAA